MRIYEVLGNSQSLDGGAMFGNAPKAVWEKWCPADSKNRVPLVTRAVLVDAGGQRVLLETGIGSFFEPRLKERFGVVEDEHVLLESLQRLGFRHSDIDVVVLSHLHFDHAGGLLAPYNGAEGPELLFSKARFVVSEAAFERAQKPHRRDRASFIPQLPSLLEESGRLHLVADGQTQSEVLGSRFRFSYSHGHTPGMLLTHVLGQQQQVFFCADLIPGRAWVHVPITMGYDRFPEQLIDEKDSLLSELERDGTWLLFTHDPGAAAAKVERKQGRFGVTHERASFDQGWDLD